MELLQRELDLAQWVKDQVRPHATGQDLRARTSAAWMSLFIYMLMAVTAAIKMVWRMKLACTLVMITNAHDYGASFTFQNGLGHEIAMATSADPGKHGCSADASLT